MDPRITGFENILRRAVRLALLQSLKPTKPGEVFFSNPTVVGLRLPVPQAGLVFVVQLPLLQWRPSLGPRPPLDTAERIRQALIDTIVESGTKLPLEPNEWLTIVGLSDFDARTDAQSQKLYLSIRGSDLSDIKNGIISREVGRTRVKVVETSRHPQQNGAP